MLIVSTKLHPLFSFRGKICEYLVTATTEDGNEHRMFRFYTDEKAYDEESFVGMTLDEAFKKFRKEDVAYLRS